MGQNRQPNNRKRYIEGLERFRERRKKEKEREPIPWVWLGMGVVVTVIGIVLAIALISLLLSREPLSTSLPTPTIIRLTAPPTPIPSGTSPPATTTAIPTYTPPPTPDLSAPPPNVTIGYYAQVVNTDGVGVVLRGGPSTDNIRVQLIDEGVAFLVIDGPAEGSDLLWWQVRLDDGVEGWVAADFLAPVARSGG
ncbi:MAG TPA: SH3 domain-containing protein [candidate division Zixibacteria bacterium]|nr:SH3 domain-containing protein [candidate division Zixibacteria bacterium]